MNLDSFSNSFPDFPANFFLFDNVSGGGVSTEYNQSDSSVALNGTMSKAGSFFGGFSYADSSIWDGEKYYVTLVYRGGSINGDGVFVMDRIYSNGDCRSDRTTAGGGTDVLLPNAKNPVVSKEFDWLGGTTGLRFGFYSSNKLAFNNYKVSIYVSKTKYVTDPSLTNSGLANIETIKNTAGTEFKFANIPGAISYRALGGTNANPAVYKVPNVGNPSPMYILDGPDDPSTNKLGWRTNKGKDVLKNTQIVSTTERNSENVRLFAQWKLNRLYIRYNTGANDAVVTGKLTVRARHQDILSLQRDI